MSKYCQKCAADLAMSSTNRCAKCGRLFDLSNARTYNTSDHPSLYRPWYRYSRYPAIWSLAAIVTCLTTVLVGNGITPVGVHVYHDLMDNVEVHIPTMALLGLWGLLLLLLVLVRKAGGFRAFLVVTAPILFTLAAVAAVVINLGVYGPAENATVAQYIISGLGWPAVCLWTLAFAVGWHPVMRILPCMLVSLAMGAYWYLHIFPPLSQPPAMHPVTFVASVPFALSLLVPVAMGVWSLKPAAKEQKGRRVPGSKGRVARSSS